MSKVSGSQHAQSCGQPGLPHRRRRLGSGSRPILLVAYGWDRTCGCLAGPKFSSSATRPFAMLGVACPPPGLHRLRSRVAPTQPEQSGLLSLAVLRRRRAAEQRDELAASHGLPLLSLRAYITTPVAREGCCA